MQQRRMLPVLDGLRGVAILLVVFHHYGPPPIPVLHAIGQFGWVGVELFFVLSGLLLFLPYARALMNDAPWPSVKSFYIRRARRILPAYFTFLAVIGTPLLVGGLVPRQALVLTPLLLHNLDGATWRFIWAFNGPLWTLAIEWQFYLILPWIALGLSRWSREKQHSVWFGLATLCAGSFAMRALAAWLHYSQGYPYPADAPGVAGLAVRLFFGIKGHYLDSFAAGMAVALVYAKWIEGHDLASAIRHRLSSWTFAAGFIILLICYVWSLKGGRPNTVDGWIWPPASAGRIGIAWALGGEWTVTIAFALITLAALVGSGMPQRMLVMAPVRFLGDISYSLYLWHPWMFMLVPPNLIVQVATLLVTATCSYFITEKPFLRRRHSAMLQEVSHQAGTAIRPSVGLAAHVKIALGWRSQGVQR